MIDFFFLDECINKLVDKILLTFFIQLFLSFRMNISVPKSGENAEFVLIFLFGWIDGNGKCVGYSGGFGGGGRGGLIKKNKKKETEARPLPTAFI